MTAGEHEIEIGPDPRESPFELPPVECRPTADTETKELAIRHMLKQAERERQRQAEWASGVRPREEQPSE